MAAKKRIISQAASDLGKVVGGKPGHVSRAYAIIPTGDVNRYVAVRLKDVTYTDVDILTPDISPERRWEAYDRIETVLFESTIKNALP